MIKNKKIGGKRELILAFALLMMGFASAQSMSITPSFAQVNVGEVVSVNVTVADVVNLAGIQFDLNYDSSLLNFSSVDPGPFLSSDGGSIFFFFTNQTPGFLDNYAVSRTVTGGIDGAGVVATLRFRGLAEGTSPITLSNTFLFDANAVPIAHVANSGSIQVNPAIACNDLDGDLHNGYNLITCPTGDDCNDNNRFVYPNAPENCTDGIDNQCSGSSGFGLVDCSDPSCDSDPVCNPGSCVVTNMSWNDTEVDEDDPVELIIETSADCDGFDATFYIYEKDGLIDDILGGGDDDVFVRPSPMVTPIGSQQAVSYWSAEWQDDAFYEFTENPEYYFIATVNGTNYSSDDFGPLLNVYLTERKWIQPTITLNPGRNSFSLPLFLDNYSIDYVFRDISSDIVMIYSYGENGFKVKHFIGNAPSNFQNLEVGKGYIVIVQGGSSVNLILNGTKRDQNLERPSITLVPGWNFVGTFSNSYQAQDILRDVTYTELYTYNDVLGDYEIVPPNTYLDGNRGYWINVDEAATFIPLTGIVIGNA